MKKTIWPNVYKFLKLSLFVFMLLLCYSRSVTSAATIHAAASECTPFPFCTLTSTAQNTPTSIPLPTSAPTQTPLPTSAPTLTPTSTPTPIATLQAFPTPQSQRRNVASPATNAIMDAPTLTTPTATPAVATSTPVSAILRSASTKTTDTSHPNQLLKDTENKGINIPMLSLGIGIPVLLLSGTLFLLMWIRQSKQGMPALQRRFGNAQAAPMQSTFPNAQTFPMQSVLPNAQGYLMQNTFSNAQAPVWMNNYEMTANATMSQYVQPTTPTSNISGALPLLDSTQVMPPPQLAYVSSDLRPITVAYPQQLLTATLNNAISSPLNDNSQPLPMDALHLSLQPNSLLPQSMAIIETPIPSSPSLLPAWMQGPLPYPQTPVPAPSLAIQPPSLKEDPILEKVMEHAQMGLFVLLGR